MTSWFDIGVNLTSPRLDTDSTVRAACENDVKRMAITGTDVEASKQAISLCLQYPGQLVCTAGVHPHYAKDTTGDYIDQLHQLANTQQVVAIGECGLDYNRNFSEPAIQRAVFEAQLKVAVEHRLPVFLHERDAFDDQIEILSRYRSQLVGGVAHCFTGNAEQMQGYLELDLYIGVTGWLCDKKRGADLRDAVTGLPLSHVLLETDAPYLMPKTLSSKTRTNVPANLPHIAAHLAECMAVPVSELQHHSYLNAMTLFQLSDPG